MPEPSPQRSGHVIGWMLVRSRRQGMALVSIAILGGSTIGAAPADMSRAQSARPGVAPVIPNEAGLIEGQVVDTQSGRPIAGARVQAWSEPRASETTTDAEGRYEVRDLPPGRYHVSAQAKGFGLSHYGGPNAGFMGADVDVRAGEATSRIDMSLASTGAISGRVLSESGDGLVGVEVEVLRERYLPDVLHDGTRPRPVGFAQTEALGVFRIAELEPGEYYVRAYTDRVATPSSADPSAPATTYAPTFFPDADHVENALPVLIAAGQEQFDVDFKLLRSPTLTLSGRLVDQGGAPFTQANVALMPIGGSSSASGVGGPRAGVAADGSFELSGLIPGEYLLAVMDRLDSTRWTGATRTIDLRASESNVEILATRGARLLGHVVRDGGAEITFDASSIRVGVAQRMAGSRGTNMMFANGRGLTPDGTFSIEAPNGTSTIEVSDLPDGWMLKAVTLDGSYITDEIVDFTDGGTRRLDVVLTDRTSGVSGTVTDRSGKAISNAIVVVFPEDRTRWTATRLLRGVAADNSGRYGIDQLPPGAYRIVAVSTLPMNAWQDSEVLDRLWPISTSLRVLEGDQRSVPVRMQPAPPGVPTGRP